MHGAESAKSPGVLRTFAAFFILILGGFPALSATLHCDLKINLSSPRDVSGLPVTRLVVKKKERRLYMLSNETLLADYHVSLGFTPQGAKEKEGDGKTPEGRYFIDWKNPQSRYRLALHISYPDRDDVARAKKAGVSPGGSVMVHGFPLDPVERTKAQLTHTTSADWTQGCVGLTDAEIDEIYERVDTGTPIDLCP